MRTLKIRDLASQAMQNPWFSYATIFLLQLKIIWGVWLFRDLTSGDTSYYFLTAWDWYRNGHLLITWSPLYTAFYGTLLHLSTDAYAATVAHRLITVLVVSVMVLALMRRLLPPGIAWLMAAWWVVLPIDFDALYEVHLFAVIPVVAAFLAILSKPGAWGRGCGLAVLFAATFLMRNELLFATLLFAALAIGSDLRHNRTGLARAYGIPLVIAFVFIACLYSRSNDPPLHDMLSRKHTLNICQTYAFGYGQRSSEWKGSPWLECQQLMQRIYGVPEPSLAEALRRNPKAMFEHFWWNLQLVPNGLQVLMFNCMSGSVTPDYIPVPSRVATAAVASLFTLMVVLLGLVMLWRDRWYWWKSSIPDHIWAWIAMACVSIVSIGVMITQRPRPSYMLAFGIVLRAAFGMCLVATASRFAFIRRLAPATPVVAIILILFMPYHYYVPESNVRRPLLDIYRRLAPLHRQLEKPDAGLVTSGWSPDLCNYIGKSRGCQTLDFRDLRTEVGHGTPWDQVLNKHGATLFYLDEAALGDVSGLEFVSRASSFGWQMVAQQNEPGQTWAVLEKVSANEDQVLAGTPVLGTVVSNNGIILGSGWYDLEASSGGHFRWVDNDAELIVRRRETGPVSLLLDVEGGPSLAEKPLSLQVFGDNQRLESVNVPMRKVIDIKLPSGNITVRLHVDSANAPVPRDPRILNFRVFKISTQ